MSAYMLRNCNAEVETADSWLIPATQLHLARLEQHVNSKLCDFN